MLLLLLLSFFNNRIPHTDCIWKAKKTSGMTIPLCHPSSSMCDASYSLLPPWKKNRTQFGMIPGTLSMRPF